MQVIILAGGAGTRLRSVVSDVPKPMANINGVPFLELLMRSILLSDPERFILCVSYKKECIINHFGSNFLGVPVVYSVEDEPLGTGGAIKQAFDKFDIEEAVVLNGDSYIQVDLEAFYNNCIDDDFSLVLKHVDNANRFGRVLVDNNVVANFLEKNEVDSSGLISAGIYKINRSILANQASHSFSFEKDVLEPNIRFWRPKYFLADDYFIDIGVPDSYMKACRELKRIVFGKESYKALFLDRDGVINKDIHYLHRAEDCIFVDGIFELCRAAVQDGYKIVVVTNQAGIGKGYFSLDEYSKLMDYIKGVFLKEKCKISAVYYCPYHQDGLGKYKRVSIYRKPKPGMLLKAAKELDLDLTKSILIGDQQSDIEAGKIAGVGKCILFTGEKHVSNYWR